MERPLEITREDGPTKGRYVGRVAGRQGEAELTFSKASPTLIIADHTSVPDSMRGTGMGKVLAVGSPQPLRPSAMTIEVER